MPEDNQSQKDNQSQSPLSGTIHQTHPNVRTEELAKCYARSYHVTDPNRPQPWTCFDCGETSDGPKRLVWRDVKYSEPEVPMFTATPVGDLGHLPDATYEERMAERALTPEQRAARGKSAAAPLPPPVHLTRDQVKVLAGHYGLHLVDPEGESGVSQHVSEKLKSTEDALAAMKKRAEAAERSASDEPARPAKSADGPAWTEGI